MTRSVSSAASASGGGVAAASSGGRLERKPAAETTTSPSRSPCVCVRTTHPPAACSAASIRHSPRKSTPSAASVAAAASETSGRNRASGRSTMSTRVTRWLAARVAAVSVPIRPAPITITRRPGCRSRSTSETQTGAGRVLVALLQARHRRPGVAQPRRPDEPGRLDDDRLAAAGGRDRQAPSGEIEARHDAVEVGDPALGQVVGRGEQRQAAGRAAPAWRAAVGRGAGRGRSSSPPLPRTPASRRRQSRRRRCRR